MQMKSASRVKSPLAIEVEGAVALSPNKTRPGDPQGLPGLLLSCIISLAKKTDRKQGYCTMKARG
ncbi:MAG: hypothetical protein II871_02860, partial [Clostridia bacterium]|nr:hypothetical protein [Clostridia bacterium]